MTMEDITTYIQGNCRYLRVSNGFTLEQMAHELGLSGRSSYRAYETGAAMPKIQTLIRLSRMFKVVIDDFILTDLKE